jgi:hypothetical protein
MSYASTKSSARASWIDAGVSSYRGPCRLIGVHITRLTREGAPSVLCDEFCESDGACRLQLAVLGHRDQGACDAGTPDPHRASARCVMLSS